jgi:hypothetical protein
MNATNEYLDDNGIVRNKDLVGTVSEATLRPEDLIPAFLGVLEACDPAAYASLKTEALQFGLDIDDPKLKEQGPEDEGDPVSLGEWIEAHPECDDDIGWFLSESIWTAMNELAQPGYYFGAHPGDGADYGFWRLEDRAWYTRVEGEEPVEHEEFSDVLDYMQADTDARLPRWTFDEDGWATELRLDSSGTPMRIWFGTLGSFDRGLDREELVQMATALGFISTHVEIHDDCLRAVCECGKILDVKFGVTYDPFRVTIFTECPDCECGEWYWSDTFAVPSFDRR